MVQDGRICLVLPASSQLLQTRKMLRVCWKGMMTVMRHAVLTCLFYHAWSSKRTHPGVRPLYVEEINLNAASGGYIRLRSTHPAELGRMAQVLPRLRRPRRHPPRRQQRHAERHALQDINTTCLGYC